MVSGIVFVDLATVSQLAPFLGASDGSLPTYSPWFVASRPPLASRSVKSWSCGCIRCMCGSTGKYDLVGSWEDCDCIGPPGLLERDRAGWYWRLPLDRANIRLCPLSWLAGWCCRRCACRRNRPSGVEIHKSKQLRARQGTRPERAEFYAKLAASTGQAVPPGFSSTATPLCRDT